METRIMLPRSSRRTFLRRAWAATFFAMLTTGLLSSMPSPQAASGNKGPVEESNPSADQPPPLPHRKAKPQHRTPNAEDERDAPAAPAGCPDRGQPLELIV